MAEKKQKLIEEAKRRGVCVGDKGYVRSCIKNGWVTDSGRMVEVTIIDIDSMNRATIKDSDGTKHIVAKDEIVMNIDNIGANPFHEYPWMSSIKPAAMTLSSIMSYINIHMYDTSKTDKPETINGVEIKEVNFNPFVVINDKKIHYQRPFCWTLKDKQKLIESIYEGVHCGNIVMRERSWNWLNDLISQGEKDVAFWDIVDGKQRLDALISFINDEFTDMYGNYYSDLSNFAQRRFKKSLSLSLVLLGEDMTDEDVINIFLHVNCSGKQMPEEHLNKIKEMIMISK